LILIFKVFRYSQIKVGWGKTPIIMAKFIFH
jgi:hypothetical protein